MALTAKAGKKLAQEIAQNRQKTVDLANQKVNKSDVSDAVNSTSQTQVASSGSISIFYEEREENNIVKETMNLLKDTCVLAFKLYILLPLFLFGSIILVFTFSSLTLNDVFSTKGAYWFVVTVVGIFSVKSKRFFIAFLISLTLFLLFGGIDYIHDWIY